MAQEFGDFRTMAREARTHGGRDVQAVRLLRLKKRRDQCPKETKGKAETVPTHELKFSLPCRFDTGTKHASYARGIINIKEERHWKPSSKMNKAVALLLSLMLYPLV